MATLPHLWQKIDIQFFCWYLSSLNIGIDLPIMEGLFACGTNNSLVAQNRTATNISAQIRKDFDIQGVSINLPDMMNHL